MTFHISHLAIKTAWQRSTCLKALIVPGLRRLKKDTAECGNGCGELQLVQGQFSHHQGSVKNYNQGWRDVSAIED